MLSFGIHLRPVFHFQDRTVVLALNLVMMGDTQQNQVDDLCDLLKFNCSFQHVYCNLNVYPITSSV